MPLLGFAFVAIFAAPLFAQNEMPGAPKAGQRPARPGYSKPSPFLEDPAAVKFGTLLSESAFFERIEKDKKIEEVRLAASEARQGLLRVRDRLIVADVEHLEILAREVGRAYEPLESAARYITSVRTELGQFHSRATSQLVAIAEGRASAVPLSSRVRRTIKAAERDLKNVSRGLIEGLKSPQNELDLARELLAARLEKLPPNDPRREKLQQSLAAVGDAIRSLKELDERATALAAHLQATRVRYFAECPPEPGPVLNREGGEARPAPSGACETFSLDLLKNSRDALADLDDAMDQHRRVTEALNRMVAAKDTAVDLAEQADGIVHPAHAKARELQAEAVRMIDEAELKLAVVHRVLSQDAPGEVRNCPHCGKQFERTRKVLDPACLCEVSNDAMQAAESLLDKARALTSDMLTELSNAAPPDAGPAQRTIIDELRGADRTIGVLNRLALAKKHSEEFRAQEFDFYPGESYAPPAEPLPERAFAPIVAYYAARESWHYPLYFDDLALERYGHHFGCVQPLVSYGKFFTDLALLPYNMYLDPPWCVQYDLGLYRPGDDAPRLIYLPRPDLHAAIFEIAVWTGLAYMP